MAQKALKNERIDLETQYWQAMQERDVDTAMRLTDDECIIAGAQGVNRVNRKSTERALRFAGLWYGQ